MKKKAILCVDDEAIIVYSLKQELAAHFGDRYIYECATSAGDALAVLEDLEAEGIETAVIITDWLMPGMKGDEFLIKAREKHGDIKSILLTGQADQEAIDRAKKDARVCTVIGKPWYPDELMRAVRLCCADDAETPEKSTY